MDEQNNLTLFFALLLGPFLPLKPTQRWDEIWCYSTSASYSTSRTSAGTAEVWPTGCVSGATVSGHLKVHVCFGTVAEMTDAVSINRKLKSSSAFHLCMLLYVQCNHTVVSRSCSINTRSVLSHALKIFLVTLEPLVAIR